MSQLAEPLREGEGGPEHHRLIGTWERQGLAGVRQVKLFTETHFAWAVHELPSGAALGVGGGTYRFDGATLTERYEFSSAPQLLGRDLPLAIAFTGADEFTQAGLTEAAGVSQDETYRRIE